ncbi:AFT1 (YGL071W) and AFT2 (YPL202C) [Zygosaccharomyces parabailii]|nr:AFT1 (YGL071W) and AFT2 (YPL202C) [Zygosaccharomyces parabailii]
MESVSSSSESAGKQSNDFLAIQADELPRALAEDQNKFIHLDPVPDFKDKAEIKPWLQKIFYPQGIEIVIERSDNIKVIFKCKAAKRGKNTKLQRGEAVSNGGSAGGSASPVAVSPATKATQKKKRSVSRFNTCPFRIRATFSLKRRKWNIVVVNNSHSHELKFNPDSDEYRKFKEKLREDEDWNAVKQFDELEYKARSNLPIEASVIPCECGLTSEIESFSIVLPSTRPTQSSNGASPVVSKPKSKKWQQQQQQRHRDKLMRNPSTEHLFSVPPSQGCPLGFMDPTSFGSSPSSPTTSSAQAISMALPTDPLADFNEIDFTDIFKPHSHSHSAHSQPLLCQELPHAQPLHAAHSSPPAINDTSHDLLNRRDEFSSLLFSPLDAATNELMTPTEDLLLSPPQVSQQFQQRSWSVPYPPQRHLQLQQQLQQQFQPELQLQHPQTQHHHPHHQQQQQQQQQQQHGEVEQMETLNQSLSLQEQPILEHPFNDHDLLAPTRLASLWPQQEEASPSPLRRVVNAVDSQSPRSDSEYPVDDLLWKMNFENA